MGSTRVAVVMAMMMVVQADVKPQKDFNLQTLLRVVSEFTAVVDQKGNDCFWSVYYQFAGKWYRVGMAYDSPGFVPFRSLVTASMGMVVPLPNGNVNLTMWDQTPYGCVTRVYHYEATSVPGQFTYYSARHGIVKDITVVDTNYTEYAIVLKHQVFNREYTQVALYARSLKVKNEVYQKFKAFALSRHLSRDSILTPPPAENCPASGY